MPDRGLAFLAAAFYAVGLSVMALAIAAHVRGFGSLRTELSQQGVPIPPIIAAIALITGEVLVSGVGFVGWLGSPRAWSMFPPLGAGLFLIFAVYSLQLRVRRPNAPCACGADRLRVTGWTVGRATALCLVVGLAAIWQDGSPLEFPESGTALLAGAIVGLLLWLLPAAMSLPNAEEPTPARAQMGMSS